MSLSAGTGARCISWRHEDSPRETADVRMQGRKAHAEQHGQVRSGPSDAPRLEHVFVCDSPPPSPGLVRGLRPTNRHRLGAVTEERQHTRTQQSTADSRDADSRFTIHEQGPQRLGGGLAAAGKGGACRNSKARESEGGGAVPGHSVRHSPQAIVKAGTEVGLGRLGEKRSFDHGDDTGIVVRELPQDSFGPGHVHAVELGQL